MSKITCVGCGMMGGNLIDSFLNKGNEVTVVDLNYEAAKKYISKGARYFPNLDPGLKDTKFVVFSLPNYRIVRSVLEKCDPVNIKNNIFVNTSSGVPSEVLEMEVYVKSLGGHYLDSTILTYQGEVGTQYGYLLYSGEKKSFDLIKDDLKALSENPIFLGEDTSVAAEIVDLVVITAHFGFPYTPLEAISKCKKYGINVDEYLEQLKELLPLLSDEAIEDYKNLKLPELYKKDFTDVAGSITKLLNESNVSERINEKWLLATNKSVANHYRKMLNIKKTNYEY